MSRIEALCRELCIIYRQARIDENHRYCNYIDLEGYVNSSWMHFKKEAKSIIEILDNNKEENSMSEFHVVWTSDEGYEVDSFVSQKKVNIFVKDMGITDYTTIKGKFLGSFYEDDDIELIIEEVDIEDLDEVLAEQEE